MRTCILILYTEDWKPLADVVVPTFHNYANKHGYELQIRSYKEPFSGFEKLIWCKNLLEDYDVIWSVDCDTMITHENTKIDDFLEPDKHFYICKDYNGVNAGSFIISASEKTKSFLNFLISLKGKDGMHCEQNAIEVWMNLFPNDEGIKVLPHPSINSYKYILYPEIPTQKHREGNWREGDLLLHLPGVGMQQRINIFKTLKEKLYNE